MSRVADLDTVLEEANVEIHAASLRVRLAVEALAKEIEDYRADFRLTQAFAELKGGIDDLYDAGADLVVSVRKECVGFDVPAQRFAIEVDPNNVTAAEIDTLRGRLAPGDLIWERGGYVLNVIGGAVPEPEVEPDLKADPPKTSYGVRVFYADETAEDIPNIAEIQVANFEDGSFPVGFIKPEGAEAPVAGRFDEEGEFIPFEVKKRIGW